MCIVAVDIDSASPRREIADSSVCLFVCLFVCLSEKGAYPTVFVLGAIGIVEGPGTIGLVEGGLGQEHKMMNEVWTILKFF